MDFFVILFLVIMSFKKDLEATTSLLHVLFLIFKDIKNHLVFPRDPLVILKETTRMFIPKIKTVVFL